MSNPALDTEPQQKVLDAPASHESVDSVTSEAPHAVSRVVVARTIEEAEQLRPVWSDWNTHPDSDIDFCIRHIWDPAAGIHPHVTVLSNNGQPSAMLVGRVEQSEIISRIGYARVSKVPVKLLTVAYQGVLGDPSEPSCELLVDSLLSELKNGVADVAMLHGLVVDSPMYRVARNRPGFLIRDRVEQTLPHRTMALSGSLEEVYQNLSSSVRSGLRRKKRQIEAAFKEALAINCFVAPADVDVVAPLIEGIARKTYQRGLGVGFRDSPAMRQRLRVCAEMRWLRIYLLTVSGTPRAFWIGNAYKGEFRSDFHGYDPEFRDYSPGVYLLDFMIGEFCRSGVHSFDFGGGDSEMKERFGNRLRMESSVYIFAPRARGLASNLLRTGAGSIDRGLRKALGKRNLMNVLKRRWRGRVANGQQAKS